MANFKISLEANMEFCKHSYEALEILLASHDISLDEFLGDAVRGHMKHLQNLIDLSDLMERLEDDEPAIHTCQNGGPCGSCAVCDEEAKKDKE